METTSQTFVTAHFDKFVVIYDGLAHWFKTKGLYLYRVSTEQDFHHEASLITSPARVFTLIPGSILTTRVLLAKRAFFAKHPINKQGMQRPGAHLCPEFQEGGAQ